MAWKKLTREKFEFTEVNDLLVGRITNVKKTDFGTKSYDITCSDGKRFYFFGSKQLDELLKDNVGKIVSITYKGTVPLKGNKTLKVFEVNLWEEEENGTLPEGFEVLEDVPF